MSANPDWITINRLIEDIVIRIGKHTKYWPIEWKQEFRRTLIKILNEDLLNAAKGKM